MEIKKADTNKTQEDFKKLLESSLKNKEEASFLGIDNWQEYLNEESEICDSCYVAYNKNQPIGYVIASPNETDHIYLSEIYVIPEARGQGISRKILQEILSLNSCTHLHAYVHEDNVAMQTILKSMGGISSGKWHDYKV